MTYELAKKLKDAGFPQGFAEHQYGWIEAHQAFEFDMGDMTKGVSAPTLSELIKACGNQFYSIWRRDNGEWRASSEKEGNDFIIGSTPEEAVANLWLELNKK